jgi:arylsulfatase A-like enzyme
MAIGRSTGAGSGPPARLAAVLALALAACDPTPERPNVLLVTIDTLRADRVGPRPDRTSLTPFLDELASRGLRYTAAYATAPWTPPSMASILTGLYPSRHGVRRNITFGEQLVAQEVLPDDLPFLPDLLQREGYATFGVAANQVLAPEHGFARGFDRYECLGFEHDGNVVIRTLEDWLPEIREREPWLVWVHFLDPHAPYQRSEPGPPPRAAPGSSYPELEGVQPPQRYERMKKVGPGSSRLAYIEALYEGEIQRVDDHVRGIFARLDEPQRTLAVVTSDHGEEFLEHGRFGHGNNLFEESVRIPLILRLPGARRAGEVVQATASLVDIVPTVLEVTGIEPPEGVQGRSLLGLWDEEPRRAVFVDLARVAEARAAIEGRWKLIDEVRPEPRRMLFDLAADPRERRSISAASAEPAARLERLARDHVERSERERGGDNPIHPLTPEQVEALQSLGYGS